MTHTAAIPRFLLIMSSDRRVAEALAEPQLSRFAKVLAEMPKPEGFG
jgi:hypothetical protein